jgi:soluble lytic murein transglycosylase-like protein
MEVMDSVFTRERLIAGALTVALGLGAAQAAAAQDEGAGADGGETRGERAEEVAPLERPGDRLRRATEVHRARAAYRDARAAARDAGADGQLERNLLEGRPAEPAKLRDATESVRELAVKLKERAERREEQAAVPAASSGALAAPETYGVSQATLDAIAACESGGDPTAVSPDGTYRGKYQFDLSTWAAVGGTGDPAAAPEAEQDMRAAMLYAQSGSSPWPVCGG